MSRKIEAKRDTTPLDGGRVREIRTSIGLSQEELAGRAKLSKGYISLIENQLIKRISLAAAQRIAAVLGAETNELISDESYARKSTKRGQVTSPIEKTLIEVAQRLERSVDKLDRIAETTEHSLVTGETPLLAGSLTEHAKDWVVLPGKGDAEHLTVDQLVERARGFISEGQYKEAANTFDIALLLAKRNKGNRHRLGEIYLGMVWPNYVLSEYEKCTSAALEAVRILKGGVGSTERKSLARAYSWLAMIYSNTGNYNLSLDYSAKALSQDEYAYDACRAAGITKSSLGQWTEAESLLKRALNMAQEAGEKLYQGLVINNLVWLYIKEERLAESLNLCLEGLRLREEIGESVSQKSVTHATRGIAYCHTNMADIFLLQRQWVLAEISLVVALELFTQIGDFRNAADQYYKFALLFLERDKNPEVAHRFAQRYHDFFKGRPFRVEEARGKRLMGKVYSALGNNQAAEELLLESVQELKEVGNRYELGLSYYELGLVTQSLGNKEQASSYFYEASSIFRQLNVKGKLNMAEKAVLSG